MIYTVRSDETLIDWEATGDARIVQNVRNILRTRRYEVPFMRGMGLSADHIDTTHMQIQSEIQKDITDAINAYEERANILDVSLESVDQDGKYVVVVKMEV